MKKEVGIAIIIGFSLGLVITIGIYTARQSLNQRDQMLNPQADQENSIDANLPSSHSLDLTSPQDLSIIDQDEVKITGITSPQSLVAVLSSDQDFLTSADDQGNFSATASLDAGENIIKVTAYDPHGNSADADVSIIFTTADLTTDNNQSADESNEE